MSTYSFIHNITPSRIYIYSLRRPIDVLNDWMRVACQISNQPVGNDVLIKILRDTFRALQDNFERLNFLSTFNLTNISRKPICVPNTYIHRNRVN